MLRIGQLARALDTTPKTIRFYERQGLLARPDRTSAGYRVYDDAAVARARQVIGLRKLGLSIEEVRALLRARDGTTLRQRLLALLDDKLREMDVALGVLQGRREDLAARHLGLLAVPRERSADCICAALLLPCTCAQRRKTG
jgi:DNA-binding transcriptional MerR regulator